MISAASNLLAHRELIATLAWKSVVVRYKQAYFGLAWTVAKPLMMMLIFSLMRSFIGIDSGPVPYPVLAYCALMAWTFFQESASEGVGSIVGNAHLIKKIYFPRIVFPLTAVLTKLVEFGINFVILIGLMLYFQLSFSTQLIWVPLLLAYVVLTSMVVALAGAAINVYFRDVAQMLPVALNMLMYASPVIYPLHLVQHRLMGEESGGDFSQALYTLYLTNPLAGIIDAFQRVMLLREPPDLHVMLPGMVAVCVLLPISWLIFQRAESHFADNV